MLERFAAWLVTGPIGFLAAGVIDWVVVVRKIAWARVRGRRVRW